MRKLQNRGRTIEVTFARRAKTDRDGVQTPAEPATLATYKGTLRDITADYRRRPEGTNIAFAQRFYTDKLSPRLRPGDVGTFTDDSKTYSLEVDTVKGPPTYRYTQQVDMVDRIGGRPVQRRS